MSSEESKWPVAVFILHTIDHLTLYNVITKMHCSFLWNGTRISLYIPITLCYRVYTHKSKRHLAFRELTQHVDLLLLLHIMILQFLFISGKSHFRKHKQMWTFKKQLDTCILQYDYDDETCFIHLKCGIVVLRGRKTVIASDIDYTKKAQLPLYESFNMSWYMS